MKHDSAVSEQRFRPGRALARVLLAVAVLNLAWLVPAHADTGSGVVSLTTLGAASTENFDSLSSIEGNTTNTALPAGWYITESGTRENEQYAADDGSNDDGDTYSYGSLGSSERALGGLQSGTLIPVRGAKFTNNTGAPINSLLVAYTGEEWRLGTAGRTDRIDFQISTNAVDLSSGTYVSVHALDFTTPDTVTLGLKNGNAAAERINVSATVSSLNIPNGATFFIRWVDVDVSGADDGLAIDDFSITPLTASRAIRGRIVDSTGAGLANVTVTRTGPATAVTDSSGNYSFANVPPGTYTLTPNKATYAFNPASRNVTVAGADVVNQNFTGYNATLSGRVAFSNGTGIINVQVRLNTGRTMLTNGAGFYTFTAMLPGAYTVTPVLSGYSFDPSLRQVTMCSANVGNINFTGGYTISGRIANSAGNGIVNQAVTRSGSSTPATTNSAGYYSFFGVVDGTYTVTPTAGAYGFTPLSRTVTVSGASVSGQNFTGATGYTVSGRIATSSGAGIGGVTVTRTGGATATTNSAGYFTFIGVPNGTYTLTPSKTGITFTPVNRTITVNTANLAGQNFTGSG